LLILKKPNVIAIDGPAGSGKSTTARLVAKKLGMNYVDSGALYRAVTLQFLEGNVKFSDEAAVNNVLGKSHLELQFTENGNLIFLDGKDVTKEIRSREVTANVSAVSELPQVREVVTKKLRQIAQQNAIVLEGRDIGTVVFPDAEVKIYMEASIAERARRRYHELKATGAEADLEAIQQDILRRDQHDSQRHLAPLSRAHDAIVLNNTDLSIEESADFIVRKIMNN
jgi:cytidylate kinase